MSVSGDYNLDSVEAFKDKFEDFPQRIDADTVVKTVKVIIKTQIQEPGYLWGETTKNRSFFARKDYPITNLNMPSDAELLDRLKATLEKSNIQTISQVGLNSIREAIELLSTIEPDKYPTIFDGLCQLIKEADDKTLFEFIKLHQLITSLLPDENLDKIQANLLFNLPLKSAEAQALLLSIRQKLSESNPIDLFKQGRTYLIDVAPIMIQLLEKEAEREREQKATLQLPLDSEKVQLLIAPLRDKILQKTREDEINKVVRVYKKAVWLMKATPGEKQLSSIEIKVVYTKRSSPNQEFVYEKKYSSAS